MRMTKAALLLATGFVVMLASTAAKAAPINETLTFDLTGFLDVEGSSTPPDPEVTGSFTVTYDPTLTYDNDTTDIVVHYLTGVTVDSTLGFTYQGGFLEFGGIQADSDLVDFGTNDIVVSFNVTNPADPTFVPCSTAGYTCGKYTGSSAVDAAGYTTVGTDTAYFYGATSTVTTSATPEPSSLLLLGTGLGALASVARRRLFSGKVCSF